MSETLESWERKFVKNCPKGIKLVAFYATWSILAAYCDEQVNVER